MKQFDPIEDHARRRAHERELALRNDHGGEVRMMFPTPRLDPSTTTPEAPAKEKARIQQIINDIYAKRAK